MSQSRKSIIEKFLEVINTPKVKNLDHYLEEDVRQTLNAQVVYNNLQEAQEYYIKEHDGETTSQWTIVECEPEDPANDTLRARISHDNKTSDTVFTFGKADKIHRIDVIN